MADNVTADPGALGAVFATDDVSGVHYPINKLAIGALDSVTLASGGNGATDAGTLRVTLSNDSTGVVNLGAIDNAVLDSIDTATTSLATTVLTEDAAHSTGAAGIMPLAVRNDALSSLAGTDGDYAPLQVDERGALVTANAYDSRDLFGRTVTASPYNDIDIQFFKGDPAELLVLTEANSATGESNVGGALFSSSTNANGSVQAVTRETTNYTSGSEVFCMFTAAWPVGGLASSHQRIGLYDANNGVYIGYEGTTFRVAYRNNGSDTAANSGAWSDDQLTGAAGSAFTSAGAPVAIDLTKLNVFRIRFGWLGSAPIIWEVMAPDGHWVVFHRIDFPNAQATPHIRNPNLPMTLDITKTAAAATDITIQTDCWGAGTIAGPRSADGDEIAFQTTATLANGATYNSGILALSPEFSQVQTTVLASHIGDITITWYRDPSGNDTLRTLAIPYSSANSFQYFAAPAFTPYVQYSFNNDSGSAQTDFYFDTKFLRRPLQPQILRVDGTIADGMVATVNRSLITAYDGSAYTNVQATTGGNLKISLQELSDGVDVGAGTGGSETQRVIIDTADVNLSAIKTAVEIIDDWDETNRAAVNIVAGQAGITAGAGAVAASTPRVTLASDDPGVALLGTIDADTSAIRTAVEIIDDWDETNRAAVNLIVGQAGIAAGTGVDGATVPRVTLATDVALPAGTNAIGKLAANSGVDIGDVDVTSISAGTNLIGDVGISGARTSGGTTLYKNNGTSTLSQVKATGGQIYWLHVINLKASVLYLQMFNLASASVTLGTTTPDLVFPIPTQGDTNGAGFSLSVPNGIAMGTGISWAITTTKGGSTAASADEAFLNLGYA